MAEWQVKTAYPPFNNIWSQIFIDQQSFAHLIRRRKKRDLPPFGKEKKCITKSYLIARKTEIAETPEENHLHEKCQSRLYMC